MDDSFNSEKHHETSDESYEHDNPARSHYPHHQHHQPVIYERPKGLKGFYQHPTTQVCLLGLTCFMCPGLYNALNGLGLSGQLDSKISANANAAVYATFAFASFFAGSVNNMLGSKRTLILGSLAYPLFIGSYLALNIHPNAGPFVIATGAILGIAAGLLWSAQGSLMLAYPVESQKGLYIGIFWSIFNLGGVVGAAVSFGENSKSKTNQVDNGTYIIFLVLTFTGVLIPLFMTDPNKMIRTDGTRVTTPRHPSWKVEFYFLWVALRTDPFILLLFPLFFTSNWFYTWQFNDFNGALFNIRTRSLNNFCYWLSQIVGSLAIGLLLDQRRLTRRARAFLGWSVLLMMVFAVHTWAYFYQREYTRETVAPDINDKMDFQDPGYPPRLCLYILCGLLDAMWQTAAYWMMGAMSNDPAKLAYFTGFYKSLQSAGAAGVWRADAVGLPYMSIFASTWALLVAGLIFALPMLYLRVHDTTPFEDEVLARMDDNGHVQSISDYHTRSIADSDLVVREHYGDHTAARGNGTSFNGLPHRLQHRHASGRSTRSRRSVHYFQQQRGGEEHRNEKDLDLDAGYEDEGDGYEYDDGYDDEHDETMYESGGGENGDMGVDVEKGKENGRGRGRRRKKVQVKQLEEWLASEPVQAQLYLASQAHRSPSSYPPSSPSSPPPPPPQPQLPPQALRRPSDDHNESDQRFKASHWDHNRYPDEYKSQWRTQDHDRSNESGKEKYREQRQVSESR